MITTKLEACKGESKRVELSVIDAAGAAVDITGWTMTLEFLATWSSTPLVSTSLTITSAAGGTAYATLTSANLTLTPGRYRYTISRTNSGFEAVLASGEFMVLSPEQAGV